MGRHRELTAIDLFAGAGGLSASNEAAGFRSIAAVDHDADAIATLTATRSAGLPIADQHGHRYLDGLRIIRSDIGAISAGDLLPTGARAAWRPDLLTGGPPCQPFSSAGAQRGLNDPRGRLFLEFVRLASELRPRYILFENVRGLLTQRTPDGRPGGVLEMVQESFEETGYAVRFAVLNAADYGAPQRRVRLYMLGTADHALLDFPAATHSREARDEGTVKPWVTLGDFLEGQPEPEAEDIVRPSPRREQELATLAPGTGLRTSGYIEPHRPSGHWGYRQDCFVADPSVPARTVRAASTPDWLRQPDGLLRRLTWQECARLQGFPHGWIFTGTKAARFRQIGNAVCVPVGLAIAEAIADGVRTGPVRRPPVSAAWPASFRTRIDYTAMEERVNGPARRAKRLAV